MLFEGLSKQALARAKAAPALVGVSPLLERGWLLEYSVADGDERILVNAIVDPNHAQALEFSYRPPKHDDPRRAQHLGRVGHLLCQALRRVPVPTLPEPPRVVEVPKRESLGLYLIGTCDRGCIFCSRVLNAPQDVPVTELAAESSFRARLPVLPGAVGPVGPDPNRRDELMPEEIEALLRARLDHREQIMVSWSGMDCLASPHFDDSVRLAHRLGFREMSVQTPGSRLLEPGFLDFLSAHSVSSVALTAHARDEASFDRIGGKVGAYRMFWDSVEQLLARGFELSFEVPCIADTVDDLPAHLAQLATYPCNLGVFYWYPSPDMDARFSSMGMSFSRAIEALQRAREGLAPKRVLVDGIPLCVAPRELVDHYNWGYGLHMAFLDCEHVALCEGCTIRDSCPGIAPVYGMHYALPEHARAIR